MTGNANVATSTQRGWVAQLRQMPRHYFAIDGGSGAHLLAALAEHHPYVRQVASPRHADVLLVIEPISQKLTPAVVEFAKALSRPAHMLIVGEREAGHGDISGAESAGLEDIFSGAHRITSLSEESVLEALLSQEQWAALASIDQPGIDESTIQLPQKHEQELATELAVLSLGPVQSLTAGPLRLLLICDGEQVLSAQVEAGYAHRGIAHAMLQAEWQPALDLARHLDPLAPLASQLAYVSALEQLQGWQSPQRVVRLREAALALERVANALWWLVRFADVLADPTLTMRTHHLATRFADHLAQCWQLEPSTWILPQYGVVTSVVARNSAVPAHLRQIVGEVEALRRHLERNRLFALRTRGIGVLATERLEGAGVSGPVLQASKHGTGDIQSRILARLDATIYDLHLAVETLTDGESAPGHGANWEVPVGVAHVAVKGPRGDIGLRLESSGAGKPVGVEWQRPSAALLPLLPGMLAGQKLADAEMLIASLDLAMREADG